MVEKANLYFKLFAAWTSQHVQQQATASARNPFELRRVLPFEKAMLTAAGPCVLFATPGMLNAGARPLTREMAGRSPHPHPHQDPHQDPQLQSHTSLTLSLTLALGPTPIVRRHGSRGVQGMGQ